MPVEIRTQVTVPKRRRALWSRTDTRDVLEGIADRVVGGINSRRGADGKGFGLYQTGDRKGRPVTLKESGRFVRGIAPQRVQQHAGDVGSTASYARFVADRYPNALALSTRDVADVVEAMGDTVEENIG